MPVLISRVTEMVITSPQSGFHVWKPLDSSFKLAINIYFDSMTAVEVQFQALIESQRITPKTQSCSHTVLAVSRSLKYDCRIDFIVPRHIVTSQSIQIGLIAETCLDSNQALTVGLVDFIEEAIIAGADKGLVILSQSQSVTLDLLLPYNTTQQILEQRNATCRLEVTGQQGLMQTQMVSMRIKLISSTQIKCNLQSSGLQGSQVEEAYLSLEINGRSFSQNQLILTAINSLPKAKRVYPSTIFSAPAEIMIEMETWESRLTPFFMCKLRKMLSSLVTQPVIVPVVGRDDILVCSVPQLSSGVYGLTLIDAQYGETHMLQTLITVNDKIKLQPEIGLVLFNESMTIQVDSQFDFKEIADQQVLCLLNKKTLGNFNSKNMACSFSMRSLEKRMNDLELLFNQSTHALTIISTSPATIEMFELPNLQPSDRQMNFIFKNDREPLRINFKSFELPKVHKDYILTNCECWVEIEFDGLPSLLKASLQSSAHELYCEYISFNRRSSKAVVSFNLTLNDRLTQLQRRLGCLSLVSLREQTIPAIFTMKRSTFTIQNHSLDVELIDQTGLSYYKALHQTDQELSCLLTSMQGAPLYGRARLSSSLHCSFQGLSSSGNYFMSFILNKQDMKPYIFHKLTVIQQLNAQEELRMTSDQSFFFNQAVNSSSESITITFSATPSLSILLNHENALLINQNYYPGQGLQFEVLLSEFFPLNSSVPISVTVDGGHTFISNESWEVRLIPIDNRVLLLSQSYSFVRQELFIQIKSSANLDQKTFCLIDENYRLLADVTDGDVAKCKHTFQVAGSHTIRIQTPFFTSTPVLIQVYEQLKLNRVYPESVISTDEEILVTLETQSDCPLELDFSCLYNSLSLPALQVTSKTFQCRANFGQLSDRLIQIGLLAGSYTSNSLPVTVLSKIGKVASVYPLVVPSKGQQNFNVHIQDVSGSQLRCFILTEKFRVVEEVPLIFVVNDHYSCQLYLNLSAGIKQRFAVGPNGEQFLQNHFEIVPVHQPLIFSVSPKEVYTQPQSLNITLEGIHLNPSNLALQVLDSLGIVIFEIVQLNCSMNNLNATLPPNSLSMYTNYLRLRVKDSTIYSNEVPIQMLETLTFLDVQPKEGFHGIDNTFFIVAISFYESLILVCEFRSIEQTVKVTSLASNSSLKCILPSDSIKSRKLEVFEVRVSIDSSNWYSLGFIRISNIKVSDPSPLILEYGGNQTITMSISPAQRTDTDFNYACLFKSPLIESSSQARLLNENMVVCQAPSTNAPSILKLQLSSNQVNMLEVGAIEVKPPVTISKVWPRFLTRNSQSALVMIHGSHFAYDDMFLQMDLLNSNNQTVQSLTLSPASIQPELIRVKMPIISSGSAVKVTLKFQLDNRQTLASGQWALEIVETPMLQISQRLQKMKDNQETMLIQGRNLFSSLNITCSLENTLERIPVLYVNSSALSCPLTNLLSETGEYKLNFYSESLDFWLEPVTVDVIQPPTILFTDWHAILQQHSGINISVQMNQPMDVSYLGQTVLQLKGANSTKYSKCHFVAEKPSILQCKLPLFSIEGDFALRLSYDEGRNFFQSKQSLTVLPMPIIDSVSPLVLLAGTQHSLSIKGRHFNPQALVAVWVGKYRFSFQQVSETEVIVSAPVLSTPKDIALDVRFETMMPLTYSNSQQVIYSPNLNLSSIDRSTLVENTGVQYIMVFGSAFRRIFNYTCIIITTDLPASPVFSAKAEMISMTQLRCPIDTQVISLISEDYYHLKISLNEQLSYIISRVTVLQKPQLYSMLPSVVYQDNSNYLLQLRGSWSSFPSLKPPVVLVQTAQNETIALLEGSYLSQAPTSFIDVVIPGVHKDHVYISVSQDGRFFSHALPYFLLQKPVITRITPSYYNVTLKATYTFGVHGANFDQRWIRCSLNDKFTLVVKYFNSSYIECTWLQFENQLRYIVGVSTNDGSHWVYSYSSHITFLNYPQILKLHPSSVPNNLDSLLKIEVSKASLDTLEFLHIRIGGLLFQERDIQILNQTYAQIKINPSADMRLTISPVSILIDPNDQSQWYPSGQSLTIGPALLFSKLTQSVVLPHTRSLEIQGIGFDIHVSQHTTHCQIGSQQYPVVVINSTTLLCLTQMKRLSPGLHSVSILVEHISVEANTFKFLLLNGPMLIDQVSQKEGSALLIQGANLFTNQSFCQYKLGAQMTKVIPIHYSCQIIAGIESCKQAICTYPFANLSSQSVTLTLTSYDSLHQTQDVILNSLIAPEIMRVENRTILSEKFTEETILVSFKSEVLDYSLIFCRFSQGQLSKYSRAVKLQPMMGRCPFPEDIKQVGTYSLALSYDNITWSQNYGEVLSFIPSLRIKQVTTEILMQDQRRQREVGILMTQPLKSTYGFSCLMQVSDKTFTLNITATSNPFVVKCLIPTQVFKNGSLSIGMLYLNELVSYSQGRGFFESVTLLQPPLIKSQTPSFVLNERFQQTLLEIRQEIFSLFQDLDW